MISLTSWIKFTFHCFLLLFFLCAFSLISSFLVIKPPSVKIELAGFASVMSSRSYSNIASSWQRWARWKWRGLLPLLFPPPGRDGLRRIRWLWICSQRSVESKPSFKTYLYKNQAKVDLKWGLILSQGVYLCCNKKGRFLGGKKGGLKRGMARHERYHCAARKNGPWKVCCEEWFRILLVFWSILFCPTMTFVNDWILNMKYLSSS